MKPKIISSVQNPEIKDMLKLADPKGRKEQHRFVVEGSRAISTFIEAGYKPFRLYVVEDEIAHMQSLFPQQELTGVIPSVMNRMSQAKTPSGIVAVFPIPRQKDLDQLQTGIVLAQVSDPGNMGTLIRTCAAMGKKSVVILQGADVWSPKVVQSSAGAIAFVDIFETSFEKLINNKKNLKLCALVVDGGTQISKDSNTLLMVGSEAHGIPQEWVDKSDAKITLAMPGKTESLNAAIAGSIAMYIAWAA